MNKLRQVPCLLGIQQTINKPPSVTFFTTFHQHEKEFLDQFQKLFILMMEFLNFGGCVIVLAQTCYFYKGEKNWVCKSSAFYQRLD